MANGHVPGWWRPLKDFYTLILPLRFNLFLLLILWVAFVKTDQGHDIVAHLAESNDFTPGFWFGVSTLGLALQVWFWSRQLLDMNLPQAHQQQRPMPLWTRWLPRALGVAVFAIVLNAIGLVHCSAIQQRAIVPQLIVALEILMLALALLFVAFTMVRRKILDARSSSANAAGTQSQAAKTSPMTLSRWAKRLFVATFVLYFAFLAVSFSISLMNMLTAPVILVFAFALWVTTGFVLVWLGHRWEMPLMTLALVLAIVISPLADNHAIRTVEEKPDFERRNVAATFDSWMQHFVKDVDTRPRPQIFIVATEGGGIRAAYWTAAVLGKLHDATGGAFTNHLFAISGISGGSVGAAVYQTAVVNTPGSVYDSSTKALAYDALAPTLASMSGPDLLQRFIPAPIVRRDRAAQLEMGWEEGWASANGSTKDALRRPFLSLYANGGSARLPSVFFNGTSVETGQRLITSNCLISDLPNADDTLKLLGKDVRISTAGLNSARFPYVSPAGNIPTSDHVVDGGYFETTGAATALQVFHAIASTPIFQKTQPHVTFIVISFRPKATPRTYHRFANELLSPPRAYLATMGAHARHAVGELPKERIDFVLEATVPQPLGWMLADASKREMDRQATRGNVAKVEEIRRMVMP
jgi:hypothetical protein